MSRTISSSSARGFTLIEVILAIVVAGVVAVMLVQMTDTSLKRSGTPVHNVLNEVGVERVLESITAQYVAAMNGASPSTVLSAIKTSVDAGTYNTGGLTVTADYVTYTVGAEAVSVAATHTLKLTAQRGDRSMAILLTEARATADPVVRY